MSLKDVKVLLGVDDERITIIYTQAESRLLSRLKRSIKNIEEIPLELEFVVDEVAIARFNRIGSEGMSQESMDGHSATYSDSLFEPYESDIVDYINSQSDSDNRRGKVMFI